MASDARSPFIGAYRNVRSSAGSIAHRHECFQADVGSGNGGRPAVHATSSLHSPSWRGDAQAEPPPSSGVRRHRQRRTPHQLFRHVATPGSYFHLTDIAEVDAFTGNVQAIRHPPIVGECNRPFSIGGFTLPFRHRPLQFERLFSCFEAVLHHLESRPQRYGLQPLIFGKSSKIANSSAHCAFGAINRKSVCADFISSRSSGASVEDVADPVTDDMPRMHHLEDKTLLSWCGVEANPQTFPPLDAGRFLAVVSVHMLLVCSRTTITFYSPPNVPPTHIAR